MKKQILALLLPAVAAAALFFGFVPGQASADKPREALPAFAPAEERPESTEAVPSTEEGPSEAPSEAPAEAPTEVPTAELTETPAEVPTEAPTDEPPEVPTEAPTEVPTEALTEAPTEVPDEPRLPDWPEGAVTAAVYINGRRLADGVCAEIGGVAYAALEDFDLALGGGLGVEAEAGQGWIESRGRCIPCSLTSLDVVAEEFGGVLCVPVRALAAAAGMEVTAADKTVSFFGVPTYPSAEDVYAEEDLYWLSRIISAEARGESFLGQAAVGSVVMNRTRNRKFPDTVKDVIFDKQFGVQFSPAYSGSINREPNESCVRAAKLTLEGFSVSDTVLFFFNASLSPGTWITANRTYTMTIGGHTFYS